MVHWLHNETTTPEISLYKMAGHILVGHYFFIAGDATCQYQSGKIT
jgi:hypothetical protein